MQLHAVRAHASSEPLPREEQLAWRLAVLAADPVEVEPEVAEMIGNRIIDNAAVAVAALARPPVVAARAQALAHPTGRSAVVGLPADRTTSPEWAAWANGVAVRELDFHDTFLAAEYSHPGDNVPPVLAVAQHAGLGGRELVRGLATAYEVQVDLARSICLHEHRIDHVAHLGPSAAAGLGTALGLAPEVVFHAIGQALHTTTATRQSRKGEISTWKAYAPAFAGKAAVEAVDRAMRGQTSPTPVYEGEDGVIARLLAGFGHTYQVPLPEPGEPKRGILDTYTKEHSAEYQAQAVIDLARRLRPRIGDTARVSSVVLHTSHHTHHVIGTGANDPQKLDPAATRETLDHSIAYIAAVALQDGAWHHERSYAPERAARPDTVALWHRTTTVEDPEWTRRYHAADPAEKAFGARMVVTLDDGSVVEDELAVADAHPLGARPFARPEYREKFAALAEGVVPEHEQRRFLRAVDQLTELPAGQLHRLSVTVPEEALGAPEVVAASAKGIF